MIVRTTSRSWDSPRRPGRPRGIVCAGRKVVKQSGNRPPPHTARLLLPLPAPGLGGGCARGRTESGSWRWSEPCWRSGGAIAGSATEGIVDLQGGFRSRRRDHAVDGRASLTVPRTRLPGTAARHGPAPGCSSGPFPRLSTFRTALQLVAARFGLEVGPFQIAVKGSATPNNAPVFADATRPGASPMTVTRRSFSRASWARGDGDGRGWRPLTYPWKTDGANARIRAGRIGYLLELFGTRTKQRADRSRSPRGAAPATLSR